MANTTNELLKIEFVNIADYALQSTELDFDDISTKMAGDEHCVKSKKFPQEGGFPPEFGIRATFAPGYSSNFDVRMTLSLDDRFCGERLIENSRIHNVEGHTIWIQSNTDDPKKTTRSAWIESVLNGPSTAWINTIEVTFEEVRDLQYYSTPKEQTYERRERLACIAERTMGYQTNAIRIPLERIVDCGHGSMSWDYVYEDRHCFSKFRFGRKASENASATWMSDYMMTKASIGPERRNWN